MGFRRVLPVLVLVIVLSPFLITPVDGASAMDLSRPGGGIAFTFSSGWASGVAAAEILEAHDMRGTFYVSSAYLRQGPWYAAYMSVSDVANLSARGHEIASMTVTQPDLRALDDEQLAAELADSQATLQAITGMRVRNFAYPYGAVDDRVATAAARHYDSGRTISWYASDFTSTVDAHHLPGFLVRQATSLDEARWLVNYAAENDVSVVLAFERIVTQPGDYDWTPQDLDALADYVQAKGMAVSTISEIVSGKAPEPLPPPAADAGTIVFTFDDGSTTHLAAADTLAANGFRGTFYVVSECSRSEANQEYCMTKDDVIALAQAGHDVESHTVRHRDLASLNDKDLKKELESSRKWISDVTDGPVRHLAYPYGSHSQTVRDMTAQYYATGRIYLKSPAPTDLPVLLAQSRSDPYLLPGVGITAGTSLDQAKAYVDYARANDVTIVLVFHDLVPGLDEYAWSHSDFTALVEYVRSTGVPVRTMAQAYG